MGLLNILWVILFFTGTGTAQSRGVGFMTDTDFSARADALGQAYSAVTDDVTGTCTNPAVLNYLVYPELTTMYRQGMMDSFYSYTGFVIPGSKSIPPMSVSALLFDGGTIELNYLDGRQDTVNLEQDWVVTFSLGRNISFPFFYGVSIKLVSSRLAGGLYNANGVAADVGILYRTLDDRLSFGLALQNFGTGLRYLTVTEPFPMVVRSGVAYRMVNQPVHSMLLAGEVVQYYTSPQTVKLNLGIEYVFGNVLVLRTGYKYVPKFPVQSVYSLGVGLKLLSGSVDYAYVPVLNEPGHRVSFTLKFGSVQLYPVGEKYYQKGMLDRAVTVWKKINPGEPDFKVAEKKIKEVSTEISATYVVKGTEYLNKSNLPAALRQYNRAVSWDETNKDAVKYRDLIQHCIKSDEFTESGQLDAAISEIHMAINIDPKNPVVLNRYTELKTKKEQRVQTEIYKLFALADKEYENRNWDECIVLFKQILNLNPHNPAAEQRLAQVRLVRKRETSAQMPEPYLTSLNPNRGKPGMQVNILGANFDIDTEGNIVRFDNVIAKPVNADKNVITVTVPPGIKAGSVNVTVETYSGTSEGTEFLVVSGKPPLLRVSKLSFKDESGDKIIAAEEKGVISFTVSNDKGAGTAFGLTTKSFLTEKSDVTVRDNVSIGDLLPGETKQVEIPVKAGLNTINTAVTVMIEVKELTGMNPDPVKLKFNTRQLDPPDLQVAKFAIDDTTDPNKLSVGNGNGIIEPGEAIEFLVTLVNKGTGTTKNTIVKIFWDNQQVDYLAETDTTEPVYKFGDLSPGVWQDIKFALRINKPYTGPENLNLNVSVSDKRKQFNKTIPLNFTLGKSYVRIQTVEIKGQETAGSTIVEIPTFGEELSKVPETKTRNPDAVAVIVGVREYKSKDVPTVEYAINDAMLVKEYLVKLLGYREGNVIYKENPTKGDLDRVFGTEKTVKGTELDNLLKPNNKSDVFVYYTGHGAPDLETKEAYFVPSDCHPNYVKLNGYSLDLFYDNLSKLPAQSITVIIDACFSGASDKGMLIKNASPLVIAPVKGKVRGSNVDVLTSSQGDQISSWYPEKQHSLYTYFLLKGLQGEADTNRDKSLSLAELNAYLNENVPYYARRIHGGRVQNPTFTGTPDRIIVQYK